MLRVSILVSATGADAKSSTDNGPKISLQTVGIEAAEGSHSCSWKGTPDVLRSSQIITDPLRAFLAWRIAWDWEVCS